MTMLVWPDGKPVVFYHGTGAREFSDFIDSRPVFFTADREYAEAYTSKTKHGRGRPRVLAAHLHIQHPFDTATDAVARKVFNREFLPYFRGRFTTLSKGAEPVRKGEMVSFIWADYVWSYLRRRDRADEAPRYDGLVVDEGAGGPYDRIAVVPLYASQIERVRLPRRKRR